MKARFIRFFLLISLVALMVGGGTLYFLNAEGQKPEISLLPDTIYTNGQKAFTVKARDAGMGIKSIKVGLIQEDARVQILADSMDSGVKEIEQEFKLPLEEMKQGEFFLVLSCTDNSWTNWWKGNTRTLKKKMMLDTKPPLVSTVSTRHNLNQGGSGLVVFEVSEDVPKCGVEIGGKFFPGYKKDNGHYYCLFSFPFDAEPDSDVPRLLAEDRAGNEYKTGFYYHVNSRKYKQDRINIPDSFLRAKMPQFQGIYPQETDLLELFLKVNRELREKNRATLREVGRRTDNDLNIKGALIRQPAATRAGFGDKRTYYYKDEEIDRQRHLGVDLASVAQDKVPAANSGKVVFAGFMGIYGNVVIIDHGLGLQSLYAHLSRIDVKKGEEVAKGEIIGRTGATGLAGGDHLHFATLISGYPVNPVEWWDKTWIEHNIWSKMDRDQ
ncbi:MAG: M23 family metallopeptidase [Thermodesulfobacteriota bacterium]